MATWNYRVVETEGVFAIYEASYDDAGNVTGMTAEPVAPMGESLEELRADLEHYLKALAAPLLHYEDIVGAEGDVPETE